ncbi:MAG: hypothetical protein KC535_00950 [Nanoarchaeota archaeon]|nr:hypothetical protein [Nanoarchaeota archaeon]
MNEEKVIVRVEKTDESTERKKTPGPKKIILIAAPRNSYGEYVGTLDDKLYGLSNAFYANAIADILGDYGFISDFATSLSVPNILDKYDKFKPKALVIPYREGEKTIISRILKKKEVEQIAYEHERKYTPESVPVKPVHHFTVPHYIARERFDHFKKYNPTKSDTEIHQRVRQDYIDWLKDNFIPKPEDD